MARSIAAVTAAVLLLAGIAAAEAPDKAARGVLDAWLAAQNGGQYASYEALYAPGFRGVRRSGGKTVELDRAGWLKDRQRMFKRPMKVAADKVKVEPAGNEVKLTFMQTFEQGSYGDVGEKEMMVAAVDGKMLIVREELRSSQRLVNAACDIVACRKVDAEGKKGIIAACDKGCEAGDADACRQRAYLATDATCGAEQSDAQAATLYEKACMLKETMSCAHAADLVQKTDPAKAAKLYEVSCKADETTGCYSLALLIRDGQGVPKDLKRALEIMDSLCRENGRSPEGTNSCAELERMYKEGAGGVKKDRAQAKEYHELYENATSGE